MQPTTARRPLASPVSSTSPAPRPAPAPKRMTLASVTRGVVDQPDNLLVYGTEGVGKTSLAANAKNVIFLPAEKGTNQLDVARFPMPQSWTDVLDAVDEMIVGEHQFSTFAIDTLDGLEGMLWTHLCKVARVSSIEEVGGGYGKGFTAALEHWRILARRLEDLRDRRGVQVILIAHAHSKTFHAPDQDSFDRYTLKMNEKAASFWREWADAVLFCTYDTTTVKNAKGRIRGVSTDERWIYTTRTAAFDAKNRRQLPPQLPLSWDDLSDAMTAPINLEQLRAEITALLPALDDATRSKVESALPRAGDDAGRLSLLLNLARTKAVRVTETETTT